MCYKYATPKLKDLLAHLDTQPEYTVEDYFEYYFADGFAHQYMPVTTTENNKKIEKAIWGLVPGWVHDSPTAKEWANKTLNARSETLFEKASFKQYIGKQRCLVWASGFFEHKWEDEKGKRKTPYFIYMRDKQPFSMGGVYSLWARPDTGEVLKTFSIITTQSNQLMSEIHNSKNRMPLIITPENRNEWLNEISKDEISELMHPLPDGLLTAHTISKLVTNIQSDRNVPEVQQPFTSELF